MTDLKKLSLLTDASFAVSAVCAGAAAIGVKKAMTPLTAAALVLAAASVSAMTVSAGLIRKRSPADCLKPALLTGGGFLAVAAALWLGFGLLLKGKSPEALCVLPAVFVLAGAFFAASRYIREYKKLVARRPMPAFRLLSVVLAAALTFCSVRFFAPKLLSGKEITLPAPVQTAAAQPPSLPDDTLKFYVSASRGSDEAAGTSPETPFGSVTAAKLAVRNAGRTRAAIAVYIEGGEYPAGELSFTAADSGTETCPIYYIAEQGASFRAEFSPSVSEEPPAQIPETTVIPTVPIPETTAAVSEETLPAVGFIRPSAGFLAFAGPGDEAESLYNEESLPAGLPEEANAEEPQEEVMAEEPSDVLQEEAAAEEPSEAPVPVLSAPVFPHAYFEKGADHITLYGCEFSGAPIVIEGSHISLSGCSVTDVTGTAVSVRGDYVTLEFCRIGAVNGCAVLFGGRGSAFYNNTVYNCSVQDASSAVLSVTGTAADVSVLYNTVFLLTLGDGVYAVRTEDNVNGFRFESNTFLNTDRILSLGAVPENALLSVTDNRFLNTAAGYIADRAGSFVPSGNTAVIHGSFPDTGDSLFAADEIEKLFNDPMNGDYSPKNS